MNCKECNHSEMRCKEIDDHHIAYTFYCNKYKVFANTLKKLKDTTND